MSKNRRHCRSVPIAIAWFALSLSAGCADTVAGPPVLTAELPLHLEDHLDAATVEASALPGMIPQPVEWHFDAPQPDWKVALTVPGLDQAQLQRTPDALRVTLGEGSRLNDREEAPPQARQSSAGGIVGTDGVGLELIWKQPLGSGHSRIALADGLAVTMFSDGEFDHLVALDAATGEERWRYPIATTYRGHDGSQDGPTSTPIIEGGMVYGLGPKGDLFSVTLADGRPIWSVQIGQGEQARPPWWGYATTPLIVEDVLIVQTGGADGRSVTGLRKQTGELLWSVGDDTVGYQSPAIGTLGGEPQVVAVSNHEMVGIRPDTGELLWSYSHGERGGEGSEQPVFVGEDRVLVRFHGDGGGRPRESTGVLYHITRNETGFAVQELWRTSGLRRSWAIPVLHEGYLYGFDAAFLTCVDLATGELVWKSRPPGTAGLSLQDGHLILFSYQGVATVAAATPARYREYARLSISDHGSYQAPTVADGRIFVRNLTEVASLRVVAADAEAPRTTDASAAPLMRGAFGAFVRRVEAAPDHEKAGLIDAYLATQERFPILEGDRIVHFIYRGQAEDIALHGSMADAESGAAMMQIPGTDLHYASYEVEPTTRWEYWFVVNYDQIVPDPLNPRRRRARAWPRRNPPVNASEVTMPGWVPSPYVDEPEEWRGGVERFVFSLPADLASDLESQGVRLTPDRDILVYLPPGYDHGSARYPLLVVSDGVEAVEQGLMDRVLENVIGRSVAPVIVAFVGGLPQELAGAQWMTDGYVQMIVNALVPHLDRTYRTLARPETRAMMGAGDGGVAAVYAALHYPEVFGKVGLQSPTLFWNPGSDLKTVVRDESPRPVEFYIDWQRYDLRIRNSAGANFDLREDTRAFAALLREKGYTVKGGEAAEGFGWASWQATTDRLLKALFPLSIER